MIMEEQNPLLIAPILAAPEKNGNPKGRPSANNSTKYGPQPKSIVSQILQNLITKKRNVYSSVQNSRETIDDPIIIEDESNQNCITVRDTEQMENTRHIVKRAHLNKCKNKIRPNIYCCDFTNCTYKTKLSSNLLKHKRTHTGEKPYLCDRCSFRTNFSNSLRVHKRLHTTERPYKCLYCDYKCNSVSNLKKHQYIKHKGGISLNCKT